MNIECEKFLWHYQLELRKKFQKKMKLFTGTYNPFLKKKRTQDILKTTIGSAKYSSHFETVPNKMELFHEYFSSSMFMSTI